MVGGEEGYVQAAGLVPGRQSGRAGTSDKGNVKVNMISKVGRRRKR